MQGIETNPGPSFTGNILLSHVNINSITSPNHKEELSQYLFSNNIDIVALTETKLDDCVLPSLYYLDDFHAPLTKHRNTHGGGVALYINKTRYQLNAYMNLNYPEKSGYGLKSTSEVSQLPSAVFTSHQTRQSSDKTSSSTG